MGTVGAYAMYACGVFAPALCLKKNAPLIDRRDRLMLLNYGRFYRTVSYIPGTVIRRRLLLKYRITERAVAYYSKKKRMPIGDTLLERCSGKKLVVNV